MGVLPQTREKEEGSRFGYKVGLSEAIFVIKIKVNYLKHIFF